MKYKIPHQAVALLTLAFIKNMKNHCYILAILTFFAVKGYSYDVINGEHSGYKVTADNLVYLITPQGKRIQIIDYPFTGITNGYHYSDPPVKPIICSWDPKGRWLCIFVPLPKVTSMYLLDLKSGGQIKGAGPNPNYPKSYGKKMVLSFTKPVRWKDNILYTDEYVKFRDGDERHYAEYLAIQDNTVRRVFEGESSGIK